MSDKTVHLILKELYDEARQSAQTENEERYCLALLGLTNAFGCEDSQSIGVFYSKDVD